MTAELIESSLVCREDDLEQKGIGMYYEMPTTKNFERHFRRLWQASQVQLVLTTAV